VFSWSWGVSQAGGMAHGGGAGASKATFNDLSIVHAIDKATPLLMKACATGEHIKEATLTARKAGKGQQEYLIIKMNDILITSVQPSDSDQSQMETVSLQASKVALEYKPQKADGSLDTPVRFTFDIKANKVG
jgi:type VI secretion system secreted protein Hcp